MSLKAKNNVEVNKYELEFEVSAQDFEAALNQAYDKAKDNISIPDLERVKLLVRW